MLKTVLTCEIRNLFRDGTVWVVAALMAAVIGYGVYNGKRWADFQKETISKAKQLEVTSLAESRTKAAEIIADPSKAPRTFHRNPADIRGYSGRVMANHAYKPPGPLAALAIGQSDLYPYIFRMNINLRDSFMHNYEFDNPHRQLSGRFDLAFVIVYLLPLFILALGYNLISSEKEEGILSLLLSQPLSLSKLVFGKVVFRMVFIFGMQTVFLLLALACSGFEFRAPDAFALFLRWLLVVYGYGVFWFSLLVFVCSRGWSSATNAMVMAGLWLALVVLLPAVFNMTVKSVHPLPSRVEYINTMRQANEEISGRRTALLSKFLEDHPELSSGEVSPAEFAGARIVTNLEWEEKMKPIQQRFDQQLDKQQALINRLSFLSPALLAQRAINDLTGTGLERQRHFIAQVDRYHQALRDYFHPKILRGELVFTGFDEVPLYEWKDEKQDEVKRRTNGVILALLMPGVLIGIVGVLAFRRYPLAY